MNCRNHRQRRGERSQGSARSNANNNRKCCWVQLFMISRPGYGWRGTSSADVTAEIWKRNTTFNATLLNVNMPTIKNFSTIIINRFEFNKNKKNNNNEKMLSTFIINIVNKVFFGHCAKIVTLTLKFKSLY